MRIEYGFGERLGLWALAVLGMVVVNGLFLLGAFRPGTVEGALTNPIGLAFVIEAFLLLGALTYLLPRWGVSRLGRGWIVVLALLGGIAFALPMAILWRRGSAGNDSRRERGGA